MLPSPILSGLGLRGSSISRPRHVHFCCGPVTRSPLLERLCRWASGVWFPSPLPSKLQGSGFYPDRPPILLSMLAFSGHTEYLHTTGSPQVNPF